MEENLRRSIIVGLLCALYVGVRTESFIFAFGAYSLSGALMLIFLSILGTLEDKDDD
jgi:hypothetical protein